MQHQHLATSVLLALLAAPVGMQAQTIPAACQPLVDAQRKQLTTPTHIYIAIAESGGKSTTYESIQAGGATYVLTDGTWSRGPGTTAAALASLNQALATIKGFSCQKTGDEVVDGNAATVYTSRADDPGSKLGGRTWIAKATGLPLRQQTTGGKVTIRYVYAGVKAP